MMDIANTYWNGEGRFQHHYDRLKELGVEFTKAEKDSMYRYYRFYNDGDYPVGTRLVPIERIQRYLELQANIVIAKAYRRYTHNACHNIIKFFANKKLQGFKAWNESAES